ncbi:hypothetical protein YC2023_043260 [Brassica napus]
MATLDGVHRVLNPDGVFISIAFGQASFVYGSQVNLLLGDNTFGDGFHYFFHTKEKRLNDDKNLFRKSGFRNSLMVILGSTLIGEDIDENNRRSLKIWKE